MMAHSVKNSSLPAWPIVRVLVWEFVRCLHIPALVWFLCGLLLPWVLFRAILNIGTEHFYESSNCFPGFYGFTIFLGFVFARQAQKGVRQFLSTLPLTTEFMFAWLLGISVATVCLTFLSANVLVQFVYGVDWPWFRPVLWLIFFVISAQNAYWRLMVGSSWEVFVAFGFAGLAIFCFAWVLGGREIDLGLPMTAMELSLLACASLLSLSIGYRSFRGMRTTCADQGSAIWLENKFGKTDMALVRLAAFGERKASLKKPLAQLTGSKAALDWISLHMIGVGGISGALIVGVSCIAVQVIGTCDVFTYPLKIVRSNYLFGITSNLLVLFCFAVGIAMGLVAAVMIRMPGCRRQTTMSAFHGVRPITNAELWRVLGKAIFRYCVWAWIVLVVYLSIFPLIVCNTEGFASEKMVVVTGVNGTDYLMKSYSTFMRGFRENPLYGSLGTFSIAAWMLLGFLVMWTTASLVSTSMFFGKDRAVGLMLGVACILLVAILFVGVAIPNRRALITTVTWTIAGVGALAATLWVFRSSLRQHLLSGRQVVGAILLWALAAAYAVNFVPPAQMVGAVLLSSLTIFGIAAGPVGLAKSRHL